MNYQRVLPAQVSNPSPHPCLMTQIYDWQVSTYIIYHVFHLIQWLTCVIRLSTCYPCNPSLANRLHETNCGKRWPVCLPFTVPSLYWEPVFLLVKEYQELPRATLLNNGPPKGCAEVRVFEELILIQKSGLRNQSWATSLTTMISYLFEMMPIHTASDYKIGMIFSLSATNIGPFK